MRQLRELYIMIIVICLLSAVIILFTLSLEHSHYQNALWKNAYWPFTVELSVKDR